MTSCAGPPVSTGCTWMMRGPPVLDGSLPVGAEAAGGGAGAAAVSTGFAATSVFGASATGARKGLPRSAIAADAPPMASTATADRTDPGVRRMKPG